MEQKQSAATLKKSSAAYIGTSTIFVMLSLISAAINYGYYPVIARLLSPSEFGMAQVLIAILLQISAIFSGLNLVVVYAVNKFDSSTSRQVVETLQKATTTLFVILTLCLLFAQNYILDFLHISSSLYLFIVALDLITCIPFILSFGYLQARKRFIAAGMLQLSVVGTKLILGALATAWFGIAGALLGFALGQVIGMALFWAIFKIRKQKPWDHKVLAALRPPSRSDLALLGPQLINISAIFIVNIVLVSFISLDILVSRHYLETTLSGLYAGASTISNGIVFVCLPLIGVLLPHLNMQSFRKSLGVFSKTLAMVIGASTAALGIFVIMPKFLLGIFGSQYTTLDTLLWKLGILMMLVALISLFLQVSAFYKPVSTAFICLAGLALSIFTVMNAEKTPETIVSTIIMSFGIILGVSFLQVFRIYAHPQQKT